MPYSTRSGRLQLSRSIGHVPVVESEWVQERLRDYRINLPEADFLIDPHLIVSADSLPTRNEGIRWIMSFDGSPQEVAAREKYPSTRVGYVQVAGVLVHLEQMLQQGGQQLVDPSIIRASSEESLYSLVMPGSNVCCPEMQTVKDSWRAEVYRVFQNYRVEETTLLDIFRNLVRFSDKQGQNGIILSRCSGNEDCTERNIEIPFEGGTCTACGARLFPTDALRVHEEVTEEHANLTSLGRMMTVLEQITMVGYISYLFQRLPRVLGSVAFVLDGPLALFGPQAWLHVPIARFLDHVRATLSQAGHRPPVIIGVEKGGQFAEHFEAVGDRLHNGSLVMLPDEYIYQHILTFRPAGGASFGRDTYYGQKFFYKTKKGRLLTITVPKPLDVENEAHRPENYPTLPESIALLDKIDTSLYEDALIPVALAHSFASIPLRTGSRVLTLLSRELMRLNN